MSPGDLENAGVESRPDPHEQDPVAGSQGVHLAGQREGHRDRPDVAVLGEGAWYQVRLEAEPGADRVGVDLGNLVENVTVDARGPAELRSRTFPEVPRELETSVQKALEAGGHDGVVARAKLVVLGARPADAGNDRVAAGMPV